MSTTKKEKRALNLSLPSGIVGALQIYSAASGEGASEIVERLLKDYLEKKGVDTVNPMEFIQRKMAHRAKAKIEDTEV